MEPAGKIKNIYVNYTLLVWDKDQKIHHSSQETQFVRGDRIGQVIQRPISNKSTHITIVVSISEWCCEYK